MLAIILLSDAEPTWFMLKFHIAMLVVCILVLAGLDLREQERKAG